METRFLGPIVVIRHPDGFLARLNEENGPRKIYIVLNYSSTYLLTSEIYSQKNEHSIFQFVVKCLTTLNANNKIEKVVIYDKVNGFLRSYVVVRNSETETTQHIDLEVTHALALSVVAKCPIFLSNEFLKKRDEEEQNENENNDFLKKLI